MIRSRLRGLALATILPPLVATGAVGQQHLIEFTVDEGTWMSLDVAPDGRTIVFELLGDLYSLPREGGPATPLATGAAFDTQPRYSPDGALIAYVSDTTGGDNVWVVGADGSNPRAVSAVPRAQMLSVAWRPNGTALYATVIDYDRPAAAEIWEYPLDGGEARRVVENANGRPAPLVSAPAPGAYSAAPASDGSIYYSSVVPRPYGSRQGASSSVMRYDPGSNTSSRVVLDSPIAMKPMTAPDGSFFIYATEVRGQTGLKLRETATGDERWLAYPIQRHQLESRATRDVLPNYAITRDSATVLAAYGGKIRSIDVASGHTATIPFSADVSVPAQARLNTPKPVATGSFQPRRWQSIAASPNGALAVATTGRIFTLADASATPSRLSATARPREYMPAWSPDGQWLAFVTWDSEGGHLWRAPADRSAAPERLSSRAALWLDPVWSLDGGQLIALRAPVSSARTPGNVPDDLQLVVVPLNGDEIVPIGSAQGLRAPHFVADPDRVILGSATELVSISLTDRSRRIEATLPESSRPAGGFGPPRPPRWRVSGTGTTIALQPVGGAITLYPRPNVGAPLDASAAVPIEQSAGTPSFTWAAGVGGNDTLTWLGHRTVSTFDGKDVAQHPLDVSLSRHVPSGTVVLRGATAITMQGDEIVANADVVVTDNRVASVGPAATNTPANARVINVAGKFIVPGFIDIHAHFPVPSELYEPEDPSALANLAFGVTSVRNPQVGPDVFALADLIEANGLPGPRVFATGPGIFSFTNVRSQEHATELLRRYRDEYGTHLIKSYLPGTRQQRQWIVAASRELGMMVTTEGGADTKGGLTHALDGFSGHEHALPVAPFYDDVAQLMGRTGITYTPTLVVSFGAALPIFRLLAEERPHENVRLSQWFSEEELYARTSSRLLAFPPEAYNDLDAARSARAVMEAGGRVAIGGHGEVQGLSTHWEMELLASGGMPLHEVLRAGTLQGAEAIGLAQDLGSIEPGKLADLVVLDRNPLDDIRATTSIRYVMKNGVLYAPDLAELWPEQRPPPAPWRAGREGASQEIRLDETIRRRMEGGRIPGAAVAVIRDGEPVLVRGYGVANLEHDVSVHEETMFQSGSLGKQFTAAGIMALVEDGLVELDISVREYLPETPDDWAPITVRHLLTHASGIPDYTSDRFDYTRNYTDRDLVRLASELELEFDAGSRSNYSNTGYVMLGVIMNRVTGAPYWEYLRSRIFDPAGMPTIRVNTEAEVVRHRARGYMPTAKGWEHAAWVAPDLNTTADGSMMLSLRDMLAWHQTVRSRSLLRPESWQAILSPMTLTSGNSYPYGFGWFVDSVGGQPVLHHGGAWQGFTTQYSYYPEQDLGVVVLANGRSLATSAIAGEVAAILEPALTPPAPPSEAIEDPDPATTAYVAAMIAKAAGGELELNDFAFVRQTIFPRIRGALEATLSGLGQPDRMELLRRETVGDDTSLEYYAWFGARRFRVTASVAPTGGLTAFRARESPE